jgi:hypothetical protein
MIQQQQQIRHLRPLALSLLAFKKLYVCVRVSVLGLFCDKLATKDVLINESKKMHKQLTLVDRDFLGEWYTSCT